MLHNIKHQIAVEMHVTGGIMDQKDELSLREALLVYTQTKLNIVNKFRKGISRDDFADFEKKLTKIDKILRRYERKLQKEIP